MSRLANLKQRDILRKLEQKQKLVRVIGSENKTESISLEHFEDNELIILREFEKTMKTILNFDF